MTDGGNASYIIKNGQYSTHAPQSLNPSRIVNKVGAGDAFMAGFWVAELIGLDREKSMRAAGIFAQAALFQQEARLSHTLTFLRQGIRAEGPISLLYSKNLTNMTPNHRRNRL